jgi:hypothetical protein
VLTILQPPPSRYLTTLATVQGELGVTDAASSAVLLDILRRASDAIARECGRWANGIPLFGVGTYQETVIGSGSQLLSLACAPVLAVTQVLRDQEVLPVWEPVTNLDDSYAIEDAEAGALYNPAGWGPTVAMMAWGWQAYSSRYILPGGTSTLRYTVTYTAGYRLPYDTGFPASDPTAGLTLDATQPPTVPNVPPVLNAPATAMDAPPLPGSVEEACIQTVKAWWLARQRDPSLASQKTGEQQESYVSGYGDRALPTVALGLLRNYRKVVS